MINHRAFLSDWNAVKGQLLKEWDWLTEGDLKEFYLNAERLVDLIQQQTGAPRESVIRAVRKINVSLGGGNAERRAAVPADVR